MDPSEFPTHQASIVIATYERLSRVERVLAAFELQPFRRDTLQVVAVTHGSNGETEDQSHGIAVGEPSRRSSS